MMADIAERLGATWAKTFPQKHPSQMLAGVLENSGYHVTNQEGPSERGADLVVEIENPFIEEPILIGVQVGSYEGEVSKGTVSDKLAQLLTGWEDNRLNYGALVLAGKCGHDAHFVVHEHNRKNPNKSVTLLDGRDLAQLILGLGKGKFFP